MISHSTIERASEYRLSFQTAKPFKHVCIDQFFDHDAAESLLRDFPPFDRENARNEFGAYGGKAVVSGIQRISDFYASVYTYLFSPQFLSSMSAITGIPDLCGDPTLYGGGTHENLNGQELDPHVDFNFQLEGGYHRRANLLLYLNKEWDPAWGGALEIHSNPRVPEIDQILEYNVTFNRAVIFETNEYSWHGFRRISLPVRRQNLSRKCLSVYLYTKERSKDEIVGPHGTFYVQRPLAARFIPGHVLTQLDVDDLRTAYTRRDHQIEMYQRLEEKLGRQIEELKAYVKDILAEVKAPLVGWARQSGRATGIFHDNWATSEVHLTIRCERPATNISVEGFIPETFPSEVRNLDVQIGQSAFRHAVLNKGSFTIDCPVSLTEGSVTDVRLHCSSSFDASTEGGHDRRILSYLLLAIVVS